MTLQPRLLSKVGGNCQSSQAGAGTLQEQEMVKREIEATDRAIDALVYELYGLTEEEVRIVEVGRK